MKFLCNSEFSHSGVRLYYSGTTYDITPETAKRLIGLDESKPLGALSYFNPMDEEANRFIKENQSETRPTGELKAKDK